MSYIVPRTCTEIPPDNADRNREMPSQSLKEFRSTPAYVLLGDPGSGKSTEFELEHQALGQAAILIPAHDFLEFDVDSHPEWRGKTLFIDGLDEVRAGSSNARTPFGEIRRRLDRLGRPRFRISCRDADWLGDHDRKHLEAISPNSDVKTLRLDPLTDSNIRDILNAHPAIDDTHDFMMKAKERGVEGLLLNPQSLGLLANAVARDGGWPQSRLETYEKACRQMAVEQNKEHRFAKTTLPPGQILEAAGQLCAVQLISGAMGYTLNNGVVDADYISLENGSHLSSEVFRGALSTNLFKGKGQSRYTPVHRHIAEFLGARHLAAFINHGLSVRRVISLITGEDGVVVTELRGLSAWLAALSTKARDHLIDADPIGVGLYGDIRGFSTENKRKLLRSLNHEAARLGYVARHSTAFGPLASSDMESTLREILTDRSRDYDHQSTVVFILHVLKQGNPLPDLSQTLMAIVRDDSWWQWITKSALDAFISNSTEGLDTTSKLNELLNDIHAGRFPDPDNELLGTLLTRLYPKEVEPSRVWDYLAAGAQSELVGQYFRFWNKTIVERSKDEDVSALLDSLQEWLPALRPALERYYLDNLPVKLLARGLRARGDELDTVSLYNWLSAGSFRGWEGFRFPDESVGEVRTWLEQRPDMQKSILLEGLLRCQDTDYFMLCADGVWYSLYGSALPPDFGPWSLDRSVALADTVPYVSRYLLQLAFQTYDRQDNDKGLSHSILVERTRGYEPLERWLADLLDPPVSAESAERRLRIEKYRDEDERRRDQWVDYVRSNADALRENRAAPALLFDTGKAYFGYYPGRGRSIAAEQRLSELLGNDDDLVEATLAGLRGTVWREDVPEADEIIRLKSESRMPYLAFPFLAGMDEVQRVKPEQLDQLSGLQMRKALTFHFCTPTGRGEDPGWYLKIVDSYPELVADVLVQCVTAFIRAGNEHIPGLYELAHMKNHAQVARGGCLPLLRAFPVRCTQNQIEALDNLLWAALQHADRESLGEIIDGKLSRKSMNVAQRVHWLAAGIVVSPETYGQQLENFVAGRDNRIGQLAAFLSPKYPLQLLTDERQAATLKLLIRLIGASFGPFTEDGLGSSWSGTPAMDASELIVQLIGRLESMSDQDATHALEVLTTDPALSRWRGQLERARDTQRVIHRDAAYRHPSVEQVRSTLSNRSPANASDLAALLVDLLDDVAIRITTGNTDEWRQYWNEDSYGRPQKPKHEESCRDALLSDLSQRLPEGVNGEPESRYANRTRADIRVTYQGFSVPVEAKKSTHRDLWSALRNQLITDYAREPASGGHGIYLVFWFGGDRVTPPPDGELPTMPVELQARLEETLSAEEARKVTVRVIDVSPSDRTPGRQPRELRSVAAP